MGREELDEVITFARTIKAKEKARLSMYEEYQKLFDKNLIGRGEAFFDSIEKMARIYEQRILNRSVDLKDLLKKNRYKLTVELMKRFIPFSDWVPPLMAFDFKFGSDDLLVDFLCRLEKKVVVEWAAGFTRTERITSMSRVTRLIDDMDDPKDVLAKLFKSKAEENATDTRSRFIDLANKELVSRILAEKLDDPQFYSIHGGKFAKYVLLRIDMEMWDIENLPGYPGTITVEHILPRTPKEGSEWVKKFDAKDREKWTNRLGNLVLLSGRKNSVAGNLDFKTKKDKYFKKKSTPFKITQKINNYSDWGLKQLVERHKKLIETFTEIYSTP